ncbi:MAG: Sb-PDE family phosphodiesterase [Spirochaetaceae bacterium]|nr:Sb-PDE family phosphodiesterase [Spirochaetaceae bacterium]
MKSKIIKKLVYAIIFFSIVSCVSDVVKNDDYSNSQRALLANSIPNLEGYVTLKCDFHIHTVFSDGTVRPEERVNEAYREGLDAIAITDHIESRPHIRYNKSSHNRSYEIARASRRAGDVIVIRGSEITRRMPPGHFNVIFITNADELEKFNYMDVLRTAKSQNAFIFWNHPGWDAQQPVAFWWPEHTLLLEQGMMHGIEVVNDNSYYPEAHQWCLEKNLTMIGNSDIHDPMQNFEPGKHRTMTLVFARSATAEAIHEALIERRTAVYFNEFIIGKEEYLKELFEKSVEISKIKTNNTAHITFKNKSGLVFHLRNNNNDLYIINPQSEQTIALTLNSGIESVYIDFIVENFLVGPNIGMKYIIKI